MITEFARLTISPDGSAEFEAAVESVVHIFRAAPGCLGMALDREIENPAHYLLVVQWESIEAHVDDFRNSIGFREWRNVVSPFFTAQPTVIHSQSISRYFDARKCATIPDASKMGSE